MRAANLAVKFLLELAALISFAVWGWGVGSAIVGALLAVALPLAAAAVWGVFCAPRSPRRLPTVWRVPLELGVFGAAAVALAGAGHPTLATLFIVGVAFNASGLTALRQWDA